jgi:hypothetical protein
LFFYVFVMSWQSAEELKQSLSAVTAEQEMFWGEFRRKGREMAALDDLMRRTAEVTNQLHQLHQLQHLALTHGLDAVRSTIDLDKIPMASSSPVANDSLASVLFGPSPVAHGETVNEDTSAAAPAQLPTERPLALPCPEAHSAAIVENTSAAAAAQLEQPATDGPQAMAIDRPPALLQPPPPVARRAAVRENKRAAAAAQRPTIQEDSSAAAPAQLPTICEDSSAAAPAQLELPATKRQALHRAPALFQPPPPVARNAAVVENRSAAAPSVLALPCPVAKNAAVVGNSSAAAAPTVLGTKRPLAPPFSAAETEAILKNKRAEALAQLEMLAAKRPLPEKGQLMQAVMDAGPLLQNLLVTGPLPKWRNPPPALTKAMMAPSSSRALMSLPLPALPTKTMMSAPSSSRAPPMILPPPALTNAMMSAPSSSGAPKSLPPTALTNAMISGPSSSGAPISLPRSSH